MQGLVVEFMHWCPHGADEKSDAVLRRWSGDERVGEWSPPCRASSWNSCIGAHMEQTRRAMQFFAVLSLSCHELWWWWSCGGWWWLAPLWWVGAVVVVGPSVVVAPW